MFVSGRVTPTPLVVAFVAAAVSFQGVPTGIATGAGAPAVDHHQHLFSHTAVALAPGTTVVTADDLVRLLDLAGIRRATILSIAYQFGNPNRPPIDDEYARVQAENDWTSREVARFPDRLIGFCGVNPLKE